MALNSHDDNICTSELSFDESSVEFGSFNPARPITKAVIIAAGNGSRLHGYQNGRPKPLLKVGGLHLLERVVLSAKKVGINEFVIVIGYQAARIRKTINAKKLGVKITWVRNIDWRRPNGVSVLKAERFVGGRFLLFMSDHIFDYRTLCKLRTLELGSDAGALCVDHNLNRVPNLDDATKVRTENGRLINLNKSLADFNAIDTGIFVLTPDLFEALRQSQMRGDESLSGGIGILSQQGRMRTVDIGDRFWQDVDTIPDARHAERLLLKATRSKGDGFISKTINRRISNRITRWLLKTPLTPNQISVLNLVFSIFVAWLVSIGKPMTTALGGVLFQLSSVLDGCDGEVAVTKLKDSKSGAVVDTVTDQLSYLSFIVGVTIGTFRATNNPIVFLIAGVLVVFVLLGLNLGRLYVRSQDSGSLRSLDSAIAGMNHSGQKIWYLKFFGMIHHLGRRDAFSFAAMVVMLFGNITIFFGALMITLAIISAGQGLTSIFLLSRSNSLSLLPAVKSFLRSR